MMNIGHRIDIVVQMFNLVIYVDRLRRMLVIDPSSDTYYRWLFIISIAVLYNVLMIIARSVFWKLHDGNLLVIWLCFDYICDFIYLLDMAVQFRTGEYKAAASTLVSVYHGDVQPRADKTTFWYK